MLGLLKSSPAGRKEALGLHSPKMDLQPSIQENMILDGTSEKLDSDAIVRAAAANAAAMNRNTNNYQASLAGPVQESPSSRKSSWTSAEKGSLRIRQGRSYHNSNNATTRRTVSSFGASSHSHLHSHFESGDLVKEQYLSVKHRCQRELGAGVGLHVLDTCHTDLRHWITDERLMRLPHKGGSWDRVLISAQHFADQVECLSQAINSFASESASASNLVFGQCLLLLEFGHENASALDTAFTLFYQIGLEIAILLKSEDILKDSPEIMEAVSRAFSDMLTIVTDVSMAYYGIIHRLHGSEQASSKLDIYARFGHHIESFRAGVHLCAYEMWRSVLDSRGEDPDNFRVLQTWLAPQDSVLALLSSDHVNLVCRAEEYTCTWLQSHLNSFFRGEDKCLLVQGKAGSGKTTMANWVIDRLQRPVSRKSISTLSFFFDSSIIASETTLAMLKTLLLQLMAQRIGDLNVFHTIMDAFTESRTLDSAHDQENTMWNALHVALRNAYDEDRDEMLAIVVDLDELEAQKVHGKQVIEKLQKLAKKSPGVRLVLFSSPAEFKHATATTTVRLSSENLADDFQTIIRQSLSRLPQYSERDEAAQEAIVDHLIAISDGSVLYASLAVRYLKLQKSHPTLDQAVGALRKSVHTIAAIVPKVLEVLSLDNNSKALLSLLVAAERPFSRKEIELLLQAQPQQGQLSDIRVNVDTVVKSIAPFVMTGEGLVILRHRAIKDALVAIPDASPISLRLKTRHQDLLMRLFLCVKSHTHSKDDIEPSISFLGQGDIEMRFASDRMLEYAVRYWPVHFRKSLALYKAQGDLNLPQEFKSVFPDSIGFVSLEAGAWLHQPFPHEALEFFMEGYRVRHAIFGEHHACVLQSAITCALFCEKTMSRPIEAIEWYFRASKIGRVVLGQQAELVTTCCTTILRLSASFVSKTRTTTMTYREETLILLVSVYKHRYGETSEEVIEMYNALVELYTAIGEEKKATEILIQIKEIHAGHQHHHSETTLRGSRHLSVTLKKKDRSEIDTYGGFLFCHHGEESKDSWTITRVEELVSMAMKFVRETQYARAEEIFLELWLRLDEHCRGSQDVEWHKKKILVTLKYVEVLHMQGRREEASALLLSCWSEYSSHIISTYESIIIQLKEVAVWMQRVEMSSVALTVFQKCYSWYKSSHKEHTEIYKQIEEHIAVTSRQIVKSSSMTSTTSTSESSEIVMREVFESSFSSTETTETTEVSSTSIELCESLTSIYMKEEKWSQAVSVIKQTLMKSSFSSFFSESLSFESIDLKSTSTSKHISLIMKLAECYIHQKRYEKVEYLYLRLYRVHHNCCGRHDDALVIKHTDLYVTFLKEHDMFNQLISFYQELLVEYRSSYGHTHERTISVLYALGDICRNRSVTHGYFVDYYVEIVTSLNQGALVCHENAFRALLIVADHYYQCERFSESLVYFRSIIATFCKFGTNFKHLEDVTVVHRLLEKYYKVIEETKIEITEHTSILKEIRQACIQYFGEDSSITIDVTLCLAEVCQRSEVYQYEAVSYYEHILKHSKTVSKAVIARSQSTLKSLYVKQVTSQSSSKTVTKEVIEKATAMSYSRYVECKTHSITSHTTLTQLEELVTLYHKQSKTESAVTEMRSLVVECVSKTTSSQELIRTAKHIASIYTSCGYRSHAQTLVRELKQQLIYNFTSKGCAFDLTKVDIRICFAFVASFEWSFRTDLSLTIASFMAELLAESMFYGRFQKSIKAKSEMHIVLMHAARLRSMLFRLHRSNDFEIVETETIKYFVSVEPTIAKSCSKTSIRSFLIVLLSHLSTRHEQLDQATMTSRAGNAAVREIRTLMRQHKYKGAAELARCTYLFLMAHEGLDDPTEISLGFQLCLLMAGRNVREEHDQTNGHNSKRENHPDLPDDQALRKEMMDLSRKILGEVLDICETHKISLIRCQWSEINDLISLLGEVQELGRLQWLLKTLWDSRDGQSSWGHDVMLALGTRLAQASFLTAEKDNNSAKRKTAIRLAEDLAYNVRRVHGARHQRTLQIMTLQASLYTSTAQHYQATGGTEAKDCSDKTRAADLARLYFKKAAVVHEDVLKLLLDKDTDDDDSDSNSNHSTVQRYGNTRRPSSTLRRVSSHAALQHHHHHHKSSITREQEVDAVKTHLRLLKIAMQRLGTWGPRGAVEYERLTAKVWSEFGAELKAASVKEEQVRAKAWKVEEYGGGKSEGGSEGNFVAPMGWGVAWQGEGVEPTSPLHCRIDI